MQGHAGTSGPQFCAQTQGTNNGEPWEKPGQDRTDTGQDLKTVASRGDPGARSCGQAGSKPGTVSRMLPRMPRGGGQGPVRRGQCHGGSQVQTGSRPRLSAAVGGDIEAEQAQLGPALQLVRC